jgi:membrane-associated phospholipid phosphatase/tRNA A-37 threonylcarbamoyl transferase component Bud32
VSARRRTGHDAASRSCCLPGSTGEAVVTSGLGTATAPPTGPRRRPSGEPPPLPRRLDRSGKYWLALGIVLLGGLLTHLAVRSTFGISITVADQQVVEWLADRRSTQLTRLARAVGSLASPLAVQLLWLACLAVLVVTRRWRHLIVGVGALLAVTGLTSLLAAVLRRPRPLAVETLGPWTGFAMPSLPVAVLSGLLMLALYGLVPQGPRRQAGKWAASVLVLLVGLSRVYLAQDSPTDVAVGVIIGVTVPLVAFRLLVPNEVFPVSYTRRRTAHLDVSGVRQGAIRQALKDQLGVVAVDVRPFGLEGSGGSTPLRVTVEGGPAPHLFGKLYAVNHLRSDRWYKLGRTLLYGGLEDERAFNSVRRLVQHEDYALRLLRDAGLTVPTPYGIVEITPEREYLLVTEFFAEASEVGVVSVDERLIDEGLAMVRRLWAAGLAHRDIKPANLLVHDGRLVLIDSAFTEVRPSPWRQAVDLANMMLVLALSSDVPTVYERARRVFSVDEIAEAFAATRGLTMPSQLRRMMRSRGRDLHAEFSALLPYRLPPIAIQRWSARRVGLTVVVLLGVLLLAVTASPLLLNSPLS